MRSVTVALLVGILLTSIGGCASTQFPQPQLEVAPTPQIVIPTSTVTLFPTNTLVPSFTPTITPTPRIAVRELIPSDRCGIVRDKSIYTVSWTNDDEFVYSYYPLVEEGGENIRSNELQWVSHNIRTGDEFSAAPTINFDNTFWKRNNIAIGEINPELAGFFSPSGRYVIYSVFLGVSFEPSARTEVWVAETKGQQKWKILEIGGNGQNIYRADWFENETKVVFNLAYEGPSEFYISDFKTRTSRLLSETAQFSGITEETWRLSPNGKTLAVVDWDRRLLLVSLETGDAQTVEVSGGSFPQWSNDGRYLYYWWRADGADWWGNIDELRVFDLNDGKISTLFDKFDLSASFQEYQGDDNCIARDYYLVGGDYAVSPDQKKILLWISGLYLLTR